MDLNRSPRLETYSDLEKHRLHGLEKQNIILGLLFFIKKKKRL